MLLLISNVSIEDKKKRSVRSYNFGILGNRNRYWLSDCAFPEPYTKLFSGLLGGGGFLTIIGLIRNVLQDVVESTRKPEIEFGNVYVRKPVIHKISGGEQRELLYLQEVKNTTKNSQAENCRCSFDMSNMEMGSFYGAWEVSHNEAIPIAYSELVKLFTRYDFTPDGETKNSITFYVRAAQGIMTNNKSMDTQLVEGVIKMSIQ
ncbi:MAG TPA: hypothetical protein VFI73_07000 [Candidatus Nitrosopolaris sp.]|nr:hypothetical protein [Candidatus Nitrosopolaris sp.]